MKRFTGHDEEWGRFLDAKENAPSLLRQELSRKRRKNIKGVFLSSVTDCYLKAEEKLRLTRQCLEVLLEYQLPVSILTKSPLILRDLDLLTQFTECRVGLSMFTVDDDLNRQFEKSSPLPSERLKALSELTRAGIHTWAFISPFLPGISKLSALLAALKGRVSEIGIEALNTRAANWPVFVEAVKSHDRTLAQDYLIRATKPAFWDEIERRATQFCLAEQIQFAGLFRHPTAR